MGGHSNKRTQPRSISNQKQTPYCFPHAFVDPNNDYDFVYGKNDLSCMSQHPKHANWTNYPSQYDFFFSASSLPKIQKTCPPRKDAIRSRLKTIYQRKKCITSNNFFKPKKVPSGISSFISKYTIQEKGPPDPNCGITIDQYFVEMEKRMAAMKPSPNPLLNGKRCISTAAPATRQHYQARDHSGDSRVKPGHDYSLGPIKLAKGPNKILLRPMREADKMPLEQQQQSYYQRPDSRYNKDSICLSLEGVRTNITRAPVMTSWGKERKHLKVAKKGGDIFPSGASILKMYGQY